MESEDVIVVTEEEAGERLDKILAKRFSDVRSRTYFQELISEKCVLLNGNAVKKRVKPSAGDEIEIAFRATPEIDLTPESIPLEILYEDADILAINKPAGMVVHPAVGNWTGTFVNALLYHCQHLERGDSLRPGIVHRLDKDTTGILLAAKNSKAQQNLIELFATRRIYKEYLAICVGNPGTCDIEAPIGRHPVHRQKMTVLKEGGRTALSRIKTILFDDSLALVSVLLVTGRTHQIRVHLQHRGTPVLGDPLYGSVAMNQKLAVGRQMLHAWRLKFPHPITGSQIELEAPIPSEMQTLIDRIRN